MGNNSDTPTMYQAFFQGPLLIHTTSGMHCYLSDFTDEETGLEKFSDFLQVAHLINYTARSETHVI